MRIRALIMDGGQHVNIVVSVWVNLATQQFQLTVTQVGAMPVETFASGGVHHAPLAFQSVRNAKGKLVPLHNTGRRVISANVAAQLTYALQGVVQHGTGTSASLAPAAQVAGKTGTAELVSTVPKNP